MESYVPVPQFPMSVRCHVNKHFYSTAMVLQGFEIRGFRTTWFNMEINVVNLQHHNIQQYLVLFTSRQLSWI